VRVRAVLVGVIAIVFGLVLIHGTSFEDVALPGALYASAAFASGLTLIAAAFVASGRARSPYLWRAEICDTALTSDPATCRTSTANLFEDEA
jgi:hypothetical protein